MRKIIAILLIIGLLIPVSVQAQGAGNILFVNYTIGVDVGNCQIYPCKSFAYAQGQAQAGDRIEMTGWQNAFKVTKDGLYVTGGAVDGGGRCVEVDANNVTIDNVDVINCQSHAIIVYKENVTIKNSEVTNSVLEGLSGNTQWGSCIKGDRGAKNLTIINNVVKKCYGEGIAVTMVLGALIENNYVEDTRSVLYYVDNSNNVIVRNNRGKCTGTFPVGNTTGIAIGEEFYSGWGAQGHDVLIEKNTIEGCWHGILANQSDVGGTLTNVIIQDNGIPSGSGAGNSLALSIDASRCSNVLVTNNKVWKTNVWVRCPNGRTVTNNILSTVTPTPSSVTIVPVTPSATLPVTFISAPSLTPTRTPTATPSRTPTRTITASSIPPTPTGTQYQIFVNGTPVYCNKPCQIVIP